MPFPAIPIIIGVGVSSYLGRKAKDHLTEHPAKNGYCSNCGTQSVHEFHEPGLNWKKTGGMAVLLGAIGLGVSGLVTRDVYECQSCHAKTLSCRTPRCTGMAFTGQYYDCQFCGQCIEGNDNSSLYRAMQDQKKLHKVKEIMREMQQELDEYRAKLRELEKERAKNKALIRDLTRVVRKKEAELETIRRRVA